MNLTKEEVQNIADLSRIRINDKEAEEFQSELTEIFSYIQQLNQVDTSRLNLKMEKSTEHALRKDIADYNFSREEMMAAALKTEEGHLKVKKVL